ncbi:MAG: homogentisate 1,2-dioxygenase [Acidobacteria bacterium]|nr:homogentisate 1,2-dioxygenase [Acidobacteriota bacterium]
MIHRLQLGEVPPKPHTVFKPDGKLAFEHCLTRQGFDGAFTILYHREPPHWVTNEEDLGPHPGDAPTAWDGHLRRCHMQTDRIPRGGSPFLDRKLLLGNHEIGVWMVHPDADDKTLVENADGDELVFVHHGSGRLETALGVLRFEEQDYVYVPRGLPHRWRLDGPATMLVIEGRTYIDLPKQFRNHAGQLTMDAPYTHRDFRAPEWPQGGPKSLGAPRQLIVKRGGRLTGFALAHDPFDIVGWDGQVWPFAFPIRAYQPKTGLIHLPPTTHITFAGGGFVVCSFVPRMVDYHEQAIPCPYPHSSVSCDEILYYVEGNFTSRKGVGPGSISLHPTGLPHGPHPGTYEASIGTKRTDELAVMVDTFTPLLPTRLARDIEDKGYNQSWVR